MLSWHEFRINMDVSCNNAKLKLFIMKTGMFSYTFCMANYVTKVSVTQEMVFLTYYAPYIGKVCEVPSMIVPVKVQ